MNFQDQKEYLDEREGIRIYSGNQSEFAAIKGAEDDLKNYLNRNKKKPIKTESEKKDKYGYVNPKNNPFTAVKESLRSLDT